MSNAFTSFLGGVVDGFFSSPQLKDYQHANRLYVRDTYARAPKLGFLYFISFNINLAAISDRTRWGNDYYKSVGLLVKRADLPKFSIEVETLNQYNRKTVIQKALKYNPVSIDLHDDNSNITRDLWKNYFQYYYADSNYGNSPDRSSTTAAFGDTKFTDNRFRYGFNNGQDKPFFTSIDIYVLHQQNFTQYTLVNPIITDWNHDKVSQAEEANIMANTMTVAYETVIYNQGTIRGDGSASFKAYYDTAPSPLSISGKGSNTLLGPGGLISGASAIFGANGTLASAKSPLDYLAVGAQLATLGKNASQLSKGGIQTEVRNVIGNAAEGVAATGNRNNITIAGAANLGLKAAATVATGLKLIK